MYVSYNYMIKKSPSDISPADKTKENNERII